MGKLSWVLVMTPVPLLRMLHAFREREKAGTQNESIASRTAEFQAKGEQIAQRRARLIQPPYGKGPAVVSQSHPIPEMKKPYDILIRAFAVALNQTNHKMPEYHAFPGTITGCDFMGTAVSTGPRVDKAPPGQLYGCC